MDAVTSLCPVCKAYIHGYITMDDGVYINKTCPEHGFYKEMVERSNAWFDICQALDSPIIYDGYMVDVTSKCNLECKYCYHNNDGKHRDIEEILAEVKGIKAPIILTGGEPTTHPELPVLLSRLTGELWLLTNGVALTNGEYFNNIIRYLRVGDILRIGLSMHPESKGCDYRLLDMCREQGLQIGTVFYVVDAIGQVDDALKLLTDYADVICTLRIKAASNLGQEYGARNKLFTSDLVEEMILRGASLDGRYSNKVSYASMVWQGKEVKCISWYDINNVILEDIAGPPFYKADDGSINNLVISCLLNGDCHAL